MVNEKVDGLIGSCDPIQPTYLEELQMREIERLKGIIEHLMSVISLYQKDVMKKGE